MLRTIQVLAAGVALAASMATTAAAQPPDRKDFQVAKDIAATVNGYTRFTIFDDVSGNVRDGVVTLTGKVTEPYKKDDIARRVAKVNGVHQVTNQIAVLPLSRFDDNLRYKIAHSIYGNSNFVAYANQANPPIHILVDNGHVTLSGVVNNNVDRMLARSLAGQAGAFSVTNNLKTDEEVRAAVEKSN